MSESDALRRIAAMWCQHDSEMRDVCAACIAQEALGIGKPLVLRGPAPGGGSPPQDATAQQVAECCALVCESRAASLFHDSNRIGESNEAHKCAAAIRGGWQDMLKHLAAGVARPGEDAPPRDEAAQKVLDVIMKYTSDFGHAALSEVWDALHSFRLSCEALRGTPPSRTPATEKT